MKRALARPSFRIRTIWPRLKFHGLRVSMQGDHVSLAVWKRVFRGDYEAPEIKALLALLKPNDKLLELGAGMGLVSAVAAKMFPSLVIHSYEANPAMIPVINELHESNRITNISVHNVVLMPVEEDGERTFYVAKSFAESSLLDVGSDSGRAFPRSLLQVAQRDIRKALSEFRPDVLICDIEGGEAELFQDIDLSCLRALVLELHPDRIGRIAEARIYDTAAAAGLYPKIELCSGTVVAFEKVAPP